MIESMCLALGISDPHLPINPENSTYDAFRLQLSLIVREHFFSSPSLFYTNDRTPFMMNSYVFPLFIFIE